MGVPLLRTVVFEGLYSGPPVLGNYYVQNLGFACAGLNIFQFYYL